MRSLEPLVLAALLAAAALAAPACAPYPLPFTVPLGASPVAVDVADFNRDGVLDLVAAVTGGVSVSLAVVPGAFPDGVTTPVFATPRDLAVGDVNRDGVPDVVVASSDPEIAVLLGVGDGSFRQPIVLRMAARPAEVMIADLTGDGWVDLLITGETTSNGGVAMSAVQVILGTPNSGFFGVGLSLVPEGLAGAALGDLDRDLRVDLVSVSGSSVAVRKGMGNGTFAPPAFFPLGSVAPGSSRDQIAIADVTTDGRLDVVVAGIHVLLGDGQGNLRAPSPTQLTVRAVSSAPIDVTDVNGDHVMDVLTLDRASPSVVVGIGGDGGQFTYAGEVATGRGPVDLATADLDQDGSLDIVTANADSQDLSVLLGRGRGTFVPPARFEVADVFSGVQDPRVLAIADRNGGSVREIVIGNAGTFSVLFVGAGGGGRAFSRRSNVVANAIATADLNGDGLRDIVISSQAGRIAVLIGEGPFGSLLPPRMLQTRETRLVPSLFVRDMDGNGTADLVTLGTLQGAVPETAVSILPGNGDGSFGAPRSIPLEVPPSLPSRLVLGDVNGDSALDLVVEQSGLRVLLGVPGSPGVFGAPRLVLDESTNALATVDLDRNGSDDLVAGRSGELILLRARADSPTGFGPPERMPVSVEARVLTIGDVNADGFRDVVVGSNLAGESPVNVLLGNGDGTLRDAESFPFASSIQDIAIADLDRDSFPELIAVDAARKVISVLFNTM